MYLQRHKRSFVREMVMALVMALVAGALLELVVSTCHGPASVEVKVHFGDHGERQQEEPRSGP